MWSGIRASGTLSQNMYSTKRQDTSELEDRPGVGVETIMYCMCSSKYVCMYEEKGKEEGNPSYYICRNHRHTT